MPKTSNRQRVLLSLPTSVVQQLDKYAGICRRGNKSGFVADAVEAYVKALRQHRRTQRLRQSYAAAAGHGLAIAQQWQEIDDDAWAKLDQLEQSRDR
jgi:metal-responsive CopG/Arc/MetJ family transcriptional regulator